jgi:UDP-glucose 4-epimerase
MPATPRPGARKVLLTGGAGYIGTHIACALSATSRRSVCIDNYHNSSPRALERVARIAPGAVEGYECDVRDATRVGEILAAQELDSVVHLAGLKAVGESVAKPRLYHDNNVGGTATLLAALQSTRARRFVFSSSCTVYGSGARMPVDESSPVQPINPYGESKLAVERMLADLVRRDPSWRIAILRYFNPVGAHESGAIGEDPRGVPNNLMPYICQTAAGRRDELSIFGGDYATADGTAVRDYIHVMDLAEGHVAALDVLERSPDGTLLTVNLGTGRGHSVLDVVKTFERVNGVRVPYRVTDRRPGDAPVCYANAALAKTSLGWSVRRGIEEMCRDAWRWQSANPDGY